MKKLKIFVCILLISVLMSQNAFAAGWSVRYVKGGSNSDNKYTDTVAYVLNKATSVIKESCTSCTNVADSDGRIGYVTYTGKYMDNSGNWHYSIYTTKYHYSTQGSHNISVTTIPAYSTIYGVYQVHYYGNSAIFSGTYGE